MAKIEAVRDQCPELEIVVLMEGDAAGAIPLAELRAMDR